MKRQSQPKTGPNLPASVRLPFEIGQAQSDSLPIIKNKQAELDRLNDANLGNRTDSIIDDYNKTKSAYQSHLHKMMAVSMGLKKYGISGEDNQACEIQNIKLIDEYRPVSDSKDNPRLALFEQIIKEDADFLSDLNSTQR